MEVQHPSSLINDDANFKVHDDTDAQNFNENMRNGEKEFSADGPPAAKFDSSKCVDDSDYGRHHARQGTCSNDKTVAQV